MARAGRSRSQEWFNQHPWVAAVMVIAMAIFLAVYAAIKLFELEHQHLVAPLTLVVEVVVTGCVVAVAALVVRQLGPRMKVVAMIVGGLVIYICMNVLGIRRYSSPSTSADANEGPPLWRAPAAVILICGALAVIAGLIARGRRGFSSGSAVSPTVSPASTEMAPATLDAGGQSPRDLIRTATFGFALRGYDTAAVDSFIEAVRVSLPPGDESSNDESVQAMFTATSPIDGKTIRTKEFTFSLRGYATSEVDAFLDQLATAVDNQLH